MSLGGQTRSMVRYKNDVLSVRNFRNLWPFSHLPPDHLAIIISRCRVAVYEQGVTLIRGPENAMTLYLIVSGLVKLETSSPMTGA
jgi:signal-transduction protein with cAMP-binding, CBS, and nucleotidyltransferase domain